MVMVYPIELISRDCSSHQFKLQKEHKSRMDTRLSSVSYLYEQPQCTLDYYKNSIIARTLFTMGLQYYCAMENLPPEIIASTLPCSFR